jgi:hypothetical protein
MADTRFDSVLAIKLNTFVPCLGPSGVERTAHFFMELPNG